MKPTRKKVIVSKDHFEQQTKASPLTALQEMIWNGFDAGGASVEVRFDVDGLGQLKSIEVEDYGDGVSPAHLDRAFGTVGNSLKVEQKQTSDGRLLHGKEGKGRFKALALGAIATWKTSFRDNGRCYRYEIKINRQAPDHFEHTEPKVAAGSKTGTHLRIEIIEQEAQILQSEDTRHKMAEEFALYLKEYPSTKLVYNGKRLDVTSLIENSRDFSVDLGNGAKGTLTVLEWKFKPEARKFLLCDDRGFTWKEEKAGIHAPGFFFTAYLKTDKVKEWFKDGLLTVTELDPVINAALDNARGILRGYFRDRQAEQAQEVVKQWHEEKIYPYTADETKSPVKEAERKVFDIVAVKVHQYHDAFREGSLDSKRLTLRLFKEALESNPGSIQKILKEIVGLPKEYQDDFADLLSRTSLQAIIEAASIVARRLDSINGFYELLFSKDWKKKLLERTQLHRLLVHELWIFGEHYTLDVDDEPLRKVLEQHVKLLGREKLSEKLDVKLITDQDGIVDLMLSRKFEHGPKKIEHLVLELKRPKVKLGNEEIQQIETYAMTVADDARFSKENVIWNFVLLGNELAPYAKKRASTDSLPKGCIFKNGNVSIWVKEWNEVLEDAKFRYEFFRKKLDIEASTERGMKTFSENYQELLTGRGKRKGKESNRTDATKDR